MPICSHRFLHVLALAIDVLNTAKHTHGNAGTLEQITEDMISLLAGLQQFEDSTTYAIQTVNDAVNNFSNTAHTHDNKDVLDGITAAKAAEWDGIAGVQTQLTSLSNGITICSENIARNANRIGNSEADISGLQETVDSLQKQIDNLGGGSIITLFQNGDGTLSKYGEIIYTFYNDGYRSLSGFVQSYPNFCSAENGYALYYNMNDFSWGGIVYTMCLTAFRATAASSIIISYVSGATDTGDLYLVKKVDGKSGAELARYIYEAITDGTAIKLGFQWLFSNSYISVLTECSGITSGDYYLAWKAVSDNTHPLIKTIKVLEG